MKYLYVALASAGCSSSGATADAAHVVPPATDYRELAPVALPDGVSSIDALAVGEGHTLYAAAGSEILRGDATTGTLSPFVALAAQQVSRVAALEALAGGGLAIASAERVIVLDASGGVTRSVAYTPAFASTGFGGASLALAPDGKTLYAVEGGGGSPGAAGGPVVHVASYALADPEPLVAREVYELGAPFEVVPSTTAGINAAAPVVSRDGTTLYVAHVVLRTVYAVGVAAPHPVLTVDTDSLQRSATAMGIASDGLLAQVALFDQSVPVFTLETATRARLRTEIPVGASPGAVASDGTRVFVAMSSGSLGPPGGGGGPPGDAGGVPADGGGGVPADGGAMAPPLDAGAPASLRIFEVTAP